MTTFVDTSALYAILDADDGNHDSAAATWRQLVDQRETLVTHSYILVETYALVQHRLGMAAVRGLQEAMVPMLAVQWVDQALHEAAVAALLTSGSRALSLVDCASFVLLRSLGLRRAFAFDEHFRAQGFDVLPA